MLALLIGAGAGCLLLVAGLVLFVVHEATPTRDGGTQHKTVAEREATAGKGGGGSGGSSTADPRDELAAKAMRSVSDDASHPSAVSSANPGVITIPAATATGPAQVPTGFPHTPAGAMAQLAAIDQVAFQSGSLTQARAVIESWAVHGGPTASSWSLITGMTDLFNQMGVAGSGSGQLALVLTLLMGQVKGSVGADFVIPCVDFELDVTLQQTARGADADCQRMVWQTTTAGSTQYGMAGGRWMIGAGFEPAEAPSVWPDTDLAIAVGYRDLRQEPHS
ncbi:hypothetical protein [uncultured Jatrophihabitans sp.]|uniref:hypothetical protein n=1 Tax=uncultured Jatrophihabitans sp. TaxID=1610747 RepID=UPI0035C949CB